MTLIVENGTGLANAESYISVADANAYFAARGVIAWDALDDLDEKEPALRKATDYLVARYRERWKGYRVTSTQALCWPRYNVFVPGLWVQYTSTEFPIEIAHACAELALRAAAGDLAPDISSDDQISSLRVGPISVDYKDGSLASKVFNLVEMKLAPFVITFGVNTARVIRT